LTVPRRLWLAALVAGIAAVVWVGYMWWFRDLSLLAVDHVTVDGVHSREGPAIERALRQTGRGMTILHVRTDELNHAVDSFPEVRSVSASAGFPNTLHIRVEQYEPVAALESGDGRRVAVAGAGILLRGVGPRAALPVVQVSGLPQGRTLEPGLPRMLVSVLGEAPAKLRPLLVRAYVSDHGVRVPLRNGPVIVFGKPSRIAAKWAAATRVLADPGAGGARFVDVRLPERPAASDSAPGQAGTGTLASAAVPAVPAEVTGATGASGPTNPQP
jgi:cell division protein FtsQ